MSIKTGTRLELPGGGQLMVTKGNDGTLRDGDTVLVAQGGSYDGTPTRIAPKELKLGKRWALIRRETTEDDGKEKIVETTLFEALVILKPPMKSTTADLRLDGEELEEMTPKVLPSAD